MRVWPVGPAPSSNPPFDVREFSEEWQNRLSRLWLVSATVINSLPQNVGFLARLRNRKTVIKSDSQKSRLFARVLGTPQALCARHPGNLTATLPAKVELTEAPCLIRKHVRMSQALDLGIRSQS